MAPDDPSHCSDDELVRQSQAGCLASFELLVRRFQVPLLRFLTHRLRNRPDAEDVAQETFLRAWRNLHRYDPAWRFSTWLLTIGRRLALNAMRRSRPAALDLAECRTLAEQRPAEPRPAAEDLWEVARRVLSEPEATALWLYYVDRLPVLEVARVLERTAGATRTVLFRARQRLRRALSDPVAPPVAPVGRSDEHA